MKEGQIVRNNLEALGAAAELLMAAHMHFSRLELPNDNYRFYIDEDSKDKIQQLIAEGRRLLPLIKTAQVSAEGLIQSLIVALGTCEKELATHERLKAEKEAYAEIDSLSEVDKGKYPFRDSGGFVSKADFESYDESLKKDPITGETIEEIRAKTEGTYGR